MQISLSDLADDAFDNLSMQDKAAAIVASRAMQNMQIAAAQGKAPDSYDLQVEQAFTQLYGTPVAKAKSAVAGIPGWVKVAGLLAAAWTARKKGWI